MTALQGELATLRAPDGSWTPVGALGATRRRQFDADLGQLLETLADVPNLLAPRTDA